MRIRGARPHEAQWAQGASRRRRGGRLGTALATVLAAGSFVVVTALQSGAVTGSISGFESGDGDLVLSSTDGSHTDWSCFVNATGFAANASTPAPCKATAGATNTASDAVNGEVEWVSGQKFDTKCPSLSTGNNPPKDEFTDVAAYTDTDTSSNVFFYGGAIRSSANGNASGDVEFNQNSGDDSKTAGCRTPNDRLVAYDFLSGGTSLDFHVLTWIDGSTKGVTDSFGGNNGTCFVKTDVMPCWGASVIHPNGSLFDGRSNQSAIAQGGNPLNNSALAVNQFSEFGVNLTQALGLTGCVNFPQQVWESRSSGSSFTSNPQDIEFQHRRIQTCGEIKVIKQTDARGQSQAFPFTWDVPAAATSTGGVTCPTGSTASFCLNDHNNAAKSLGSASAANNDADNTLSGTNVPQGTYTVSEGTEPGSFSFEGLTCNADTASGSSVSTSGATATITLKPSGTVTCVYENQLHSGAIVITKTGKDKNCVSASTTISEGVCTAASTADLSGATFKITTDGTTVVTGAGALQTGSNGTVCFAGLPWATGGTTYYVTETGHPTGYAVDTTTAQAVSVTRNADCSSTGVAAAATTSLSDSPLTDVTVHAQAQVAGTTQSSISCVDSAGHSVGSAPSSATTADNITATRTLSRQAPTPVRSSSTPEAVVAWWGRDVTSLPHRCLARRPGSAGSPGSGTAGMVRPSSGG